jgi:hypothetical protein
MVQADSNTSLSLSSDTFRNTVVLNSIDLSKFVLDYNPDDFALGPNAIASRSDPR